MTIYHYNPATFDFTAAGVADESPLEPGVYLIPAYAVSDAPPVFDPATHFCRWTGHAWQTGLYPALEPTPEPTPITLKQARDQRLSDLAAHRYGRETGGITVGGVNIQTDRESQATLTGAYVAVQLNPARLIDWKASDGTWTQIDTATVEFLAGAVADHVQHCFSVEKSKGAEIMALTTVEDALNYDVTTGWLS